MQLVVARRDFPLRIDEIGAVEDPPIAASTPSEPRRTIAPLRRASSAKAGMAGCWLSRNATGGCAAVGAQAAEIFRKRDELRAVAHCFSGKAQATVEIHGEIAAARFWTTAMARVLLMPRL
jgi:hypothetical protein